MSSAQDQPPRDVGAGAQEAATRPQESARMQESARASVPRPAPHYEGQPAHAAEPSPAQKGVTFAAAVLLMLSGVFNFFEGLAAVIRGSFFVVLPNYAYNISVTGWGWFHLILGVVAFLTGCFLFVDSPIARVIGVIIASVSAIVNFLYIPYLPGLVGRPHRDRRAGHLGAGQPAARLDLTSRRWRGGTADNYRGARWQSHSRGRSTSTSGIPSPDWTPFEPPVAPYGSPNVLYIVLDDVGFSAMNCYGGPIDTPNIDRIANNGVRYTQWHTTALCSPTRSCLLTGRNHTRNSMACITEAAIGFPNGSGTIPPENGMLSEILGRARLEHLHRRQVAPVPGVGDERGLAAPELAHRARLRAVLRVPRRRDEPVVSGPRLRQPPGRSAALARGRLPPHRRHHRQGARVHQGLQGARAGQAVLPVLRARRLPRAAPRAEGVGRRGSAAGSTWATRPSGSRPSPRQKDMGIVPQDTELPPVNPLGTMESHTDPPSR